jgi:hypothetical protein
MAIASLTLFFIIVFPNPRIEDSWLFKEVLRQTQNQVEHFRSAEMWRSIGWDMARCALRARAYGVSLQILKVQRRFCVAL